MKKLMGLLFEEEEVIEEEEVYEEPTPAPLPLKREEKKVVQQPKKQVQPQPQQTQTRVVQQAKPLLSTESVDGLNIPNPHTKVVVEEPKPESKKISMNIDDLVEVKQVVKHQEVQTQVTKKKQMPMGYEFTPVISPIFGVDEKDAEAVIPTAPKKKIGDSHIGTIISPMYGVDKTAEPDATKLETSKSSKPTETEMKAEKDVINLTLDDILARTAALSGKKATIEEDEEVEYVEKKVINNRNLSLFDDGSDE